MLPSAVLRYADGLRDRIKIFLYVLLRDIEFSMDPTIEIEKKIKCVLPLVFSRWALALTMSCSVVTRPAVKSEPHMGNQMPLDIRRVIPEQ